MQHTLRELIAGHPGLDAFIPLGSDKMFLISGPNGEVYWANKKFTDFIGYSLYELTRPTAPILWTNFTVQGEDLSSDLEQAEMCMEGKITSYVQRKEYLPKNQSAKFVEVFVRRWPEEGEFKFFVVDVTLLQNGHEQMARAYETFTRAILANLDRSSQVQQEMLDGFKTSQEHMIKVIDHLEDLNKTQSELVTQLKISQNTSLNGLTNKLIDNPKFGVPVLMFIIVLAFGEQGWNFIKLFLGHDG